MKNGEVYGIDADLNEGIKVSKSAKLIYGVTKNLERTEREIKRLEAIRKPSEGYTAFTHRRIALCEASSNKDEQGRPKTIPGPNGLEYDIADRAVFDKALDLLRNEFAAAIDEHNAVIARFNKYMDEDSELKIYKIKYSILEKEQAELDVKDRLDGVQTRRLWFMIEDDLEQPEAQADIPELKLVK